MPKRPILSDEQGQQHPADLRNHTPKPYLREGAGAILKLAHGISVSARALLSAAFVFALVLSHTSSARAQGNFVYINNNVFGGPNTVSAFSVGADCSLTPVPGSPFPTGGTASAAGVGSANQAEVCGNNLYVANSQSSTITVFAINPATGALSAVGSPVSVPGDIEVPFSDMNFSCTPDGRFLYVSRTGVDSINIFSRATDGSLTLLQSLFSGGFSPSDIEVSPNGAFLLVSNSESRTVVPFTINQADGRLTMGTPLQIGQVAPIEIEINCASTIAFVGSNSGVYVFSLGAGGALTPVMGSPFDSSGDRDSNIQLSPDERFLFVSHFLSNTVSVMSVGAGGTLTEIAGSPFPNTGGAFPSFVVTNASGTCLFALDQGATAFSIAADGSLTRVGAPTGGSSSIGGIAAYPAAICPADLSISKSASGTGVVGSTLAYEITVTNQGPATATNVLVADILPPGTSFVVGSCMTLVNGSPSGTCMVVGDNLTATFPSLAVGQTATVKYSVVVTVLGGQLSTLLNAVSVSSDNPDPNPNNNTASVLTQVFDICLQDDSNPGVVFFGNSVTGDYQFCCNGTVFTDRATVIRKGSIVTFEQNGAGRRLVARYDGAVFRGTAALQLPPGTIRCTITDRNTRNNTCQCVPVTNSASQR
jgi:6-phosphogluconolactonase